MQCKNVLRNHVITKLKICVILYSDVCNFEYAGSSPHNTEYTLLFFLEIHTHKLLNSVSQTESSKSRNV